MLRKLVDIFAVTLLIVMLVITLSGFILSHIPLVAYVVTDSMEPTMKVSDVFFIVPKLLAGKPNIGDIVVLEYPNNPNIVVHRIVGITEQGYITQGDKSPFSDQQGGYPFAKEEMIIGKVFYLFNKPLLIPKIGAPLSFLSFLLAKNLFWVAVGMGGLGILSLKFSQPKHTIKRKNKKPTFKVKHLYFVCLFILASSSIFMMVTKTGVSKIDYLTSEAALEDDLHAVLPGSNIKREAILENNGFLPLYVMVQTENSNIHIEKANHLLWPGSSERVQIDVTTSPEIGWHSEQIRFSTYLPLMPLILIEKLSQVNYYLPIVFISSFILLIGSMVYKLIGDGNKPLLEHKNWILHFKISLRRILSCIH